MAWYFGDVRIFVTEEAGQGLQTVARLQPLEGGTIHQTFGYEDEIGKIVCVVVGSGDLATLKGYRMTGSTYTLSGWGTDYGDYYLHSISWNRTPAIYQTLRSDLDCESPVYNVEMELYLEP